MENEITKSEIEEKTTVKLKQARAIRSKYRIVRFRGAVLYRSDDGWEPLSSDEFARICYSVHGAGIRQSQVKDLQHLFFTSADDLTPFAQYVAMPDGRVWDMDKLKFTGAISPEDCVYTTSVSATNNKSHRSWLEEVTLGDKDLADDIIKALAPVFMKKKPFGVFWFLGNGANGKSTTLKALYAIFGSKAPYSHNRWFNQLTVKQIEDDRHVLSLNGSIANVCLESNDGHIKDTGNYKNLAEHSTFGVRVLGTHDMRSVDGNVHVIFNANNIPTFADKTQGVRRRTFTIPFNASFPQDNTFDEKLFGKKGFLSDLLGDILETAQKLAKNGYNYEFSSKTIAAKKDYDEEVNTAETYFEELIRTDIWAFTNFADLTKDYNAWCDERSLSALGKKHIFHAAKNASFVRKTYRIDDKLITRYVFGDLGFEELDDIPFRWGMFQKSNSNIEIVTKEDVTDKTYEQLMALL